MIFRNPSRIFRTLIAAALLSVPGSLVAEPLRVALSPDYKPLAFRQEGKLASGVGRQQHRRVGLLGANDVHRRAERPAVGALHLGHDHQSVGALGDFPRDIDHLRLRLFACSLSLFLELFEQCVGA